MKRSILLCVLALSACGPGSAEETAAESAAPADTMSTSTPVIGAIPEVQRQVDRAEADMAERARQAEEQLRQAEGGTSQP
ncbi:MAG TPA: hypothetical protein VM759_02515 [Longimicrobium sp.]|nr:hypothetical protein [Longimicrobium sp.]